MSYLLDEKVVLTSNLMVKNRNQAEAVRNPLTAEEFEKLADVIKEKTGKKITKQQVRRFSIDSYEKLYYLAKQKLKTVERLPQLNYPLDVKNYLYPFEVAYAHWKALNGTGEEIVNAVEKAVSVMESGISWEPLERKRLKKILDKIEEKQKLIQGEPKKMEQLCRVSSKPRGDS